MQQAASSRSASARPPEKGVFPLDHFGECKEVQELNVYATKSLLCDFDCKLTRPLTPRLQLMQKYMACLRENNNLGERCREASKDYISCRMSR